MNIWKIEESVLREKVMAGIKAMTIVLSSEGEILCHDHVLPLQLSASGVETKLVSLPLSGMNGSVIHPEQLRELMQVKDLSELQISPTAQMVKGFINFVEASRSTAAKSVSRA